jgi:hypothetical protein
MNIEQIKQLSDEEWENYRKQKWNEKKEEHSKPAPSYYLKNKNDYVIWLKEQKARSEKAGKPFTLDLEKIEGFNDAQWDDYRNKQWAKKSEPYQGPVKDWFMKREDYIKRFFS